MSPRPAADRQFESWLMLKGEMLVTLVQRGDGIARAHAQALVGLLRASDEVIEADPGSQPRRLHYVVEGVHTGRVTATPLVDLATTAKRIFDPFHRAHTSGAPPKDRGSGDGGST